MVEQNSAAEIPGVVEEGVRRDLSILRSPAVASSPSLCCIFERPLIGRTGCSDERWEMRLPGQRMIVVVYMIVVFEGDRRGPLTGIFET